MNAAQISFELFPPRSEQATQHCLTAIHTFDTFHPAYYSVTFGAAGSSQTATRETVGLAQQQTTVPIAPHISCIGSTKAAIAELLDDYMALGVNRLVALRGDLPAGQESPGAFKYANELITFIREHAADHFHIEVAAYPEFHPQSANAKQDLENFKRKIDAGAHAAITQYFYNPDAYFRFLSACNAMNITVPIVPGIMPIHNLQQLAKFSDNCGAEIPRWVRKRLNSLEDDKDAVMAFGIDVVVELCQKLLTGGAPGLHFYTLNRIEPTRTICERLQSHLS